VPSPRSISRPSSICRAGNGYGRRNNRVCGRPLRPHFVKARVRVRRYQNGTHAIFHGPGCLARYDAAGVLREDAKQAARSAARAVLPKPDKLISYRHQHSRTLGLASLADIN
jgi:hypothetical protein